MMDTGRHVHRSWLVRVAAVVKPLAAAVLPAAFLVACGQSAGVQVASIPPPQLPPAASAGAVFQGQVTSVDAAAGRFTMAVHVVWAPQIRTVDETRAVAVDPGTRWPAGVDLAALRPGVDLQVKSADDHPGPDGTWTATEVQLFDLE